MGNGSVMMLTDYHVILSSAAETAEWIEPLCVGWIHFLQIKGTERDGGEREGKGQC